MAWAGSLPMVWIEFEGADPRGFDLLAETARTWDAEALAATLLIIGSRPQPVQTCMSFYQRPHCGEVVHGVCCVFLALAGSANRLREPAPGPGVARNFEEYRV